MLNFNLQFFYFHFHPYFKSYPFIFSQCRFYYGEIPKINNNKSHHTAQWIQRQITDRYVIKAQQENYRSRAAFKLIELDDKFLFLKKNKIIIDLGSYPGGWLQVAHKRSLISNSNHSSLLIGIDKLQIIPIQGVHFIKGDIQDNQTLQSLLQLLGEKKADIILCDLSPQCTGIKQDDHLNSANLCLLAAEFMESVIAINGWFIIKMFYGFQTQNFKVYLKSRFKDVKSTKPRSSRSESCEMYFVCKNFIGRSKISEEVQTKGFFSTNEGYI